MLFILVSDVCLFGDLVAAAALTTMIGDNEQSAVDAMNEMNAESN